MDLVIDRVVAIVTALTGLVLMGAGAVSFLLGGPGPLFGALLILTGLAYLVGIARDMWTPTPEQKSH
ncbi:hypothetical protein [Nesterenkonia rhizosphaerae]|uniref:Major facilitator superfamily (MFS) profile domain-containing protein n=1 Tax=Nesterenkonia rhizosphaerae TaxID=1348272 RepID=A0ABP9G6F4_9MICC